MPKVTSPVSKKNKLLMTKSENSDIFKFKIDNSKQEELFNKRIS